VAVFVDACLEKVRWGVVAPAYHDGGLSGFRLTPTDSARDADTGNAYCAPRRRIALVLPKVDEIGLKILFLLIPGIIALGLIKSIGPRHPRSDFESGLQIFIYGVVCYAIAGFLEGPYLWKYPPAPGKSFW
jgi:hypothetical protein